MNFPLSLLLLSFALSTVILAGPVTTKSWLTGRKHIVPLTKENCDLCQGIVNNAKGPWSRGQLYQQKYMQTIVYFLSGAQKTCGTQDCRRLIGQISHIYRMDKSLEKASTGQICMAAKVCDAKMIAK